MTETAWYAALWPDERGPSGAPAEGEAAVRASRWADAWRSGRFVPEVPVAVDAATEALMAESSQGLRDRLAGEPSWAPVIASTWPDGQPAGDSCGCGSGPESSAPRWPEDLLVLVAPLVDRARQRVRAAVPAVRDLPDHALLRPDRSHLLAMIKRVFVLELAVNRERGLLCGTSSEDRFRCMMRRLGHPGAARSLMRRYPVLARELVAELDRWVETSVELAVRLEQDAEDIGRAFAVAEPRIEHLVAIRRDAGDRHRGGRSVAVLSFAHGHRLVYKPRCLRAESMVNRLAADLPLRHRLRPVDVLPRAGYGWAAFQEPAPCPDMAAVGRYFYRQGAWTAVFHALRGHDMHMDNIIAVGEHPMPIDMEAVFQVPPEWIDLPGGSTGELRESALATALPPQPIIRIDDLGARRQDISGLTGAAADDGLDVDAEWGYVDEGTDLMRAVRRRRASLDAPNRPTHDGQVAPVDSPAFMAGFTDAYRLLMAERPLLLAPGGPVDAFAGTRTRAVVRSTRTYQRVLDEAWHPDLLRDGIDRSLYFSVLRGRGPAAGSPTLSEAECRQLAGLDVPVFETDPADDLIRDPSGEVVGRLRESGLAAVRRRISEFSEADLHRQRRLLAMALATVEPPLDRPVAATSPRSSRRDARSVFDRDMAVAAATAIGREIVEAARRDTADGGPEWTTLLRLGDRYWTVGSTDLGLASGVCGIALFLSALDGVAPGPGLRELVEDLRATLFDPEEPPTVEDLEGLSVGAFEELGSAAYLAARLGDPAYGVLLPAIEHNLRDAAGADVLTGAAGAALVLLAGPGAPAGILRTAARKIMLAPPTGPGFGRGLAGAAYALARVGDALHERRYIEAAEEMLAAARPLDPGVAPSGWSDGLAGLVLARATLGAGGPDLAVLAGELAGRLDAGIGDDSLCQGRLGAAEALLAAGRLLDDAALVRTAESEAEAVARRVLDGTAMTGVPNGAWTPSLATGAAGIGYGLLRFAYASRVPSVLLVA